MDNIISVSRVDFLSTKATSVKKTDEGYLMGSAPIAKLGIMTYYLADGTTRKELVNEDTLFNGQSMDSLKMKPITDTHPPERLLDSRTVKRRKVGFTGENLRRDGEFLVTPLTVTDSDAITNIDEGRMELSPGYTCDLKLEKGVYQGENYDAIQLNRKYNHVALCDKARGGSDLRLQLDSVEHYDGFEVDENSFHIDKKSNKPQPTNRKENRMDMKVLNIDGIGYEGAPELVNFATKQQARADTAEGKVNELTTQLAEQTARADTAEGERDQLKTDNEALKKVDHSEAINDGVKARIQVMEVARAVLDEEVLKKIEAKTTNDEIKALVIKSKSPDVNLDDRAPEYIDARYDAIVEGLDFDPEAIANQRKDSVKQKSNSSDDPVEKARKDSEERIRNSHKDMGGFGKTE